MMYLYPLLGGILLGISATLLLLFNGRIAGISGICSGLITSNPQKWRIFFLLGIVLAGYFSSTWIPPHIVLNQPWFILAIAGFLVGFGAKLGNGCTSGHGICGIGRLSKRSIIAVCIFMLTAIITVFIHRTILG